MVWYGLLNCISNKKFYICSRCFGTALATKKIINTLDYYIIWKRGQDTFLDWR